MKRKTYMLNILGEKVDLQSLRPSKKLRGTTVEWADGQGRKITRFFLYKDSYLKWKIKNRNRMLQLQKNWREKVYFSGKREEIIKRDNYCCTKCGMTRKQHLMKYKLDITVDHVDGKGRYSKEYNNDPSNLTTLCLPCHGRKDKIRGLQSS